MEVTKSNREWMASVAVAALLAVLPGVASSAGSLQLEDYRGKVVVLDFWASWCVPCRRSFPWMNDMQEKYADQGLVIIAVNLDNNAVDAAQFLQEYPANFRIVYDSDKTLAQAYAVQAMPTSFLIDRDGKVIDAHMGFKVRQQADYEATIANTLALTVSQERQSNQSH